MEAEAKVCQNCQKNFTVEPEDFAFYEKMSVPAPTWCPECRMIRRFAFRNPWSLFWRNCDECGERTMSMYPPEDATKVYCPKCWWSDTWDGTEYGMDYDPSRPFLEQVQELIDKTPYVALETQHASVKNSDYSNALAWSKDCYQVFWADFCESVYYSSVLNTLKYSIDCLRGFHSELAYESLGFTRNYRTFFSEECTDSVDIWFSRDCYNSNNLIGCVNLRGASYCIFNVKYSKEEYAEKMKELRLDTWSGLRELEKKAHDFWNSKPYREFHGNSLNLNSTGEYTYRSKNSKEMYLCGGAENCKWVQMVTVRPVEDCYDYSGWGNNASLVYESASVGEKVNNIKFSAYCYPDCLNLEYCIFNVAGKNNFGCVNLKRKSYCILNKEYTKEEYEKLKTKIIEDMKKNPYIDKLGRTFAYGEFFPPEMGKFAYNKSNAIRFFPKTKEEALKEGYNWNDTESPIVACTMKADALPETIKETKDSILEEIIECFLCTRAYKITKGELDLMRKLNLPLPHECPKCRESKRFARLNKPQMYNRNCMKCNAGIYTPYAPQDPRIVYCVSCYQQEFA